IGWRVRWSQRSEAVEGGVSAVGEGGAPLGGVLGGEGDRLHLTFIPDRLVQRKVGRGAQVRLRGLRGDRWAGGDRGGELLGAGEQVVGGQNLADQAPAQRLLGVHLLTGHQHQSGVAGPHRLGEQRDIPPPPTQPSLISGAANVAVSAASRMSQVRAASRPPPKAYPFTAATTGLRSSRSASQ